MILPPGLEYNPKFFDPVDLDDAKRIVIGHGVAETESKWEIETFWTMTLFKQYKFLNQDSVVLDWGCGIGRLAKAIIEAFDCKVVGVDINSKMLEYAKEYVNHQNFETLTVDQFKNSNEFKFTNAIAVWALQHSIDVEQDLDLIKKNLIGNGKVFVFEQKNPCIPTTDVDSPWFLLFKSNFILIDKKFKIINHGIFPKSLNILENNNAWWGFFKNQ